jgi:hypothetical protein
MIKLHTFAIFTALGLITSTAWSQQVSMTPSVLDSHPTEAEFREEIARARIVAHVKIVKILRQWITDGKRMGETFAVVQPIRVYKGSFESETPCVGIEFYQALEHKPDARLPEVGDELILPIDVANPNCGAQPMTGEKHHYFAKFYYTIAPDKSIHSIFGFPPEMQQYAKMPAFENLILNEVGKPHPKPAAFKTADVLFRDDFNDGSLAGWTFLEGERGFLKMTQEQKRVLRATAPNLPHNWNDETWVGPGSVIHNILPDGTASPDSRVTQDPTTGIFHGAKDGMPIEFGVVNGRLRMRGGRYWLHLVAVAGDPEWTDYQLDVDMHNFNDPALAGKDQPVPTINNNLGQVNYRKFGPYGRLNVPNLPYTSGEHSFVAVEFGIFGNYDVAQSVFGNDAFQIRCKYPESPLVWRDHSVMLRQTRILDYQPWPIPQEKPIHVTAKYFGRHVEGWIDGVKIIDGEIPENHPGAKSGRIGLWTFETWCEFDNVKVTRLVSADATER